MQAYVVSQGCANTSRTTASVCKQLLVIDTKHRLYTQKNTKIQVCETGWKRQSGREDGADTGKMQRKEGRTQARKNREDDDDDDGEEEEVMNGGQSIRDLKQL